MQSKTLIVVGMHRSGTSLVTNWLHRCGLQVGESLLAANTGNEEGHFEDVEFLKLHEEILASNDLPCTGLVYGKQIDVSVYQLEKLKSVIKVKNQRYKQWGWKEPRTCLFLNMYRELIPHSKYLVILRDYASVVNSLLKRDFTNIHKKYMARGNFQRIVWNWFRKNRNKHKLYSAQAEYYLRVWIDYNKHILDTLKELPDDDYIVVNYSELQKDDEHVFSFLTDTWHFALSHFPFKEVYKEDLMSGPPHLEPFLKDKNLLAEAKSIEEAFTTYRQKHAAA